MTGRQFREALHSGKKKLYGTCIVSPSPHYVSMIARTKCDFVFIDTEHIALPRDTLAWMCTAYSASGIPNIVRVPEPEPYRVCEYLDGGANGIVAPYIETVEQVKMLVGATKLRPLKGIRLKEILDNLKPMKPEEGMSSHDVLYQQVLDMGVEPSLVAFMRQKADNTVLLLNIESKLAVASLEQLLSIPGVDASQVGPHDLSCNTGVPEDWENPAYLQQIDTIIDQSRRFGMGVGVHYCFKNDVQHQIEWVRRGANMILHSSDLYLVEKVLGEDLEKIRSATE